MQKKYFILFLFSVIFLTVVSTTIAVFSNTTKTNLDEKVNQEIDYLEARLLNMINLCNNIELSNSVLLIEHKISKPDESSKSETGAEKKNTVNNNSNTEQGQEKTEQDENNSDSDSDKVIYSIENKNILNQDSSVIDWDYLKDTAEILYSSWPIIMIDLHGINIENKKIHDFSKNLDALVLSVKEEDKRKTLNNLKELYGGLSSFIEQFSDDENQINIAKTKTCIINSYVLLEDDNWNEIQVEISNAREYFLKVLGSINQINKQQSNINKTYVGINEMNNITETKDKELFYLKYKNLMESILKI